MMKEPNASSNQNKVAIVAVAVLIVVVGVAFYVSKYRGGADIERTTLAPDVIPEGFPADFPREETGVVPAQNLEIDARDGRQQSTRSFTSSLTADEHIARYEAYFNDHGWNILDARGEKETVVLLAEFEGSQISVTITELEDKTTKVLLTATY